MSMLDKLFSREIRRRTGAHVVSIYIDDKTKTRKRTRAAGTKALGATKVTTKKTQGSFWHRLDVRFPWLKILTVLVIGGVAVLDLLNLTISRIEEEEGVLKVAPMMQHVKATERTLEGKMLVALTFDDGPFGETTPKLLDILTEKDAPATFFMLGMMAERYPEIVQRVYKERHEVASHSMYHQNLVRLEPEAMRADLDQSKGVFKAILGQGPAYVRPPYGNYNDFVAAAATRPLILWSVDTEDWLNKNTDAIVATAMSEVHDGAVILMHDIYPTSVEAVPALIDALRGAGYELATVKELAKARGVTLAPGEAYYNFRP